MTNGEKFKDLFGLYATEVWAMPEKDFLEWLNTPTTAAEPIKIIDEEEFEEYIVAYIIDLLMEAGYYDRSVSS